MHYSERDLCDEKRRPRWGLRWRKRRGGGRRCRRRGDFGARGSRGGGGGGGGQQRRSVFFRPMLKPLSLPSSDCLASARTNERAACVNGGGGGAPKEGGRKANFPRSQATSIASQDLEKKPHASSFLIKFISEGANGRPTLFVLFPHACVCNVGRPTARPPFRHFYRRSFCW